VRNSSPVQRSRADNGRDFKPPAEARSSFRKE